MTTPTASKRIVARAPAGRRARGGRRAAIRRTCRRLRSSSASHTAPGRCARRDLTSTNTSAPASRMTRSISPKRVRWLARDELVARGAAGARGRAARPGGRASGGDRWTPVAPYDRSGDAHRLSAQRSRRFCAALRQSAARRADVRERRRTGAIRVPHAQIADLAWPPCSPASRRSPSTASIRAPSSVEADLRAGLPAFTIVGLADRSVREARERVRAAIQNSGFEFPMRRITVNLAPAHLRKAGPGFDLAIAVRDPRGERPAPAGAARRRARSCGELSLTGEVRPCRGVLAAARGARRRRPARRARRRRAASARRSWSTSSRSAARRRLRGAARACSRRPPAERGRRPASRRAPATPRTRRTSPTSAARPARSRRSRSPRPAATTCCSSARPERARRCSRAACRRSCRRSTPDEALEVTRIHSVAGLRTGDGHRARPAVPRAAPHDLGGRARRRRPAARRPARRRSPTTACCSSTSSPSSTAARSRRCASRSRTARSRSCGRTAWRAFPTRCTLVAATNPCPVRARRDRRCRCGEADLLRHARRLSRAAARPDRSRRAASSARARAISAPPP